MKIATTIRHRKGDSSNVLAENEKTKSNENKRSSRAFGPVDVNTISGIRGRQNIEGRKFGFVLPKSPNTTHKKKPKPATIDPGSAGHNDSSSKHFVDYTSKNAPQAAKQPKSSPSDSNTVLSTTKSMPIGLSVAEPTAQESKQLDWKPFQKELDELFVKQSKERMKGVPMIGMPKILEKNEIQLYDHQKEG